MASSQINLGLSETWITSDELYEAIFFKVFFEVLKQVPICFSCLGICYNAVLL